MEYLRLLLLLQMMAICVKAELPGSSLKIEKDFAAIQRDGKVIAFGGGPAATCLLYTSPSPRDGLLSRMPSSA